MDGVERDLRAALRPAAGGRQARHAGRADHLGVRPAGGPAHLARRPHRPPAPDRRPRRGARAADHRSCPLLLTRQVDPRSGTVLVWGAVHAGEAANAIPQHGVLRGTLRTADHATGASSRAVRALVAAVLAPTGVGYDLNTCAACRRWSTRRQRAACWPTPPPSVLGPDAATSTEQSSGGEDFAWYLEQVPGRHGPARRVVGRGPDEATSTSPRSTWTSAPSRSASAS